MTVSADSAPPDPSADFGAYLREARERRGVSLREIARVTRIAVMALEALERNDVSRLPGGIFSRAFVRSYAGEVGLDPEETVRRFIERFPSDSVVAGSPYVRDTSSEEVFESRRRTAGLLLALAVISIPIIGIILYLTLAGGGAKSPTADDLPAAVAAGTPLVARLPAPEVAGEESSQRLVVVLEATGLCWVSVIVDGERVFERVLRQGERERLEASRDVVLSVGAPEALELTINGRAARVPGRPGQVVSVRIDQENYREFVEP